MTTTPSLRAALSAPPVRDALGIGLAVGLSGAAFGTAAVAAGLTAAQASVLSLLAFTGASQFALIGVIAGGGELLAGALGALLLGARNTLYGLRLSDLLGWRGARRLIAAHGVIDETTAVAVAQRTPADARTAFAVSYAVLFATWNATTLLGALATERVGDTDALGLDAVGPAIFLALLWPRLREGRAARLIAAGGAIAAVAAVPVLPPGVPVLVAGLVALAALIPRRRPAAPEDGAQPAPSPGGTPDEGGTERPGTAQENGERGTR
ncbi:AzlC family ABC transporter permease [Nocardiopsis coralliicola]